MESVMHLKNADIRYWIQECPHEIDDCFFKEKSYECKVESYTCVKKQQITMELNLHKDVNSYGVLEVDFKPEKGSNILKVKIAYTEQNRRRYNSDLAKYDEFMYCGLPKEYQEKVFHKIKEYIEINPFSGGELIIPFAVNSEVRSSVQFFEMMIEIIMELLKINALSNIKEVDNCDDIVSKTLLNNKYLKMKESLQW